MWRIYESRSAQKRFKGLPDEVVKRYEKWKDIVLYSGVQGLRLINGFHDEALSGQWRGYRSSRLNLQYRVIYEAKETESAVYVIKVASHDYRRQFLAKRGFVPAKTLIEMSVGESVRVLRELQEMSQADLGKASGIPQSTISGIESGKIKLGLERAKTLARALKCHPAVILFPGWNEKRESAA
jgi:addiction module RelE/StbE family toxin